jgi:hypothetical protein
LEQLTDEDRARGRRWNLDEYPATRVLLETGAAGQIVVGDPEGDPAEVAELVRLGHSALLMIPMPLGGGGQGLMEVYRRHSQAFTSAEIDRARVVALQFATVLDRIYR